MLINDLKKQIVNKKIRIVFPETDDVRIFNAAKRLAKEQLLTPVMIGQKELYEPTEGMEFINPQSYEHLAVLKAAVLERRAGKLTPSQVDELLLQPTFFGTALIYSGQADGLIAGATQSTGDTVRPALQLIKTKPNISKTFGYFIMIRNEEMYLMGDCAINPEPTANELAEFAIELGKVSWGYGIEPKIAMLSFSTAGSAETTHTQKVREATAIAKATAPSLLVDGEMQFDAAVDPTVGQTKFPGSKVAGYANAFIFPDLNAGNIGYKMIQRLGGFEAVGPFLAGLNAPVNDLSRGCSEEDVYKTAIVTASQTLIHD